MQVVIQFKCADSLYIQVSSFFNMDHAVQLQFEGCNNVCTVNKMCDSESTVAERVRVSKLNVQHIVQ